MWTNGTLVDERVPRGFPSALALRALGESSDAHRSDLEPEPQKSPKRYHRLCVHAPTRVYGIQRI